MFRKVKDFFTDCFNSVSPQDVQLGVVVCILGAMLLFAVFLLGGIIYQSPMVALAIFGIVLAVVVFVALVWFFMGLYVKLTRPPVQHYEDVWNLPPD